MFMVALEERAVLSVDCGLICCYLRSSLTGVSLWWAQGHHPEKAIKILHEEVGSK